ncbi:hypothetical protein L0Y59_00075 [Candidatus Uhrbacteria bacterium]|nr:hypothetical protein [Candidatus Uhrbacteria bacterium]
MLCIAVVGTALVLVALNAWMNQQGGNAIFKDRYTDGFKEGYTEARQRMAGAGCILNPEGPNRLRASVKAVLEDSLIVEQMSLDTHPDVDRVSDERTVTISPETKIVRYTDKSGEQLAQEMRAYVLEQADSTQAPPSPFIEETLSLSDIKAGDVISIVSSIEVRLAENIPAQRIEAYVVPGSQASE